jgi:catalase
LDNKHSRPLTTTDAGIPVSSDEHSLTVGPDGPILLQDHYLVEQMANFNRERIPERQPHAKGSGAFGYFEVTSDVAAYTKAAVFQPTTRTNIAAYTRRRDDDDWGQAGTLVRKVMDDGQRDRLVSNVVGHLRKGVSELVLQRTFEYWRNIDKGIGDRIEAGVKAG